MTTTPLNKDCIGNNAFYNEEFYTIKDVNEKEQLIKLEIGWVRIENCTYIPF